MSGLIKTDLAQMAKQAAGLPFAPKSDIPQTDVQKAIEYLRSIVTSLASADFLVKTATASLSAERVVTDTATVAWDWATSGQAKAAVVDLSIITGKLADDAVTFAKMQNIATDSLVGRDTAGSGDPENITLNATLEMTGAQVLQRAALSGHVVATAGSNTTTIQAGVITTTMLVGTTTFDTDGTLTANSDTRIASQKAVKTYVDALALVVSGALIFKGAFDASAGSFPGTAGRKTGWFYRCSVAGTVDGVTFTVGDDLYAVVDNASTSTYAANWLLISGTISSVEIVSTLSANALAYSKLAQGSARSVLGVTGNATADLASIQGTADQVLVVNTAGTALTFATVATGGLTAAAVTFAKIQNIATDSLIGRDTAGTGVPENITLNSTLEMTGSQVLQRAAISGSLSVPAGSNTASETVDLIVVIGDGTNVITTGAAGNWVEVDFAFTIVQWSIIAKQSGSISIDLWRTTHTAFDAGATHPVAADKISATAPITFSAATKATDSTLTGWTKTISAQDILAFNVASVTTCTQVQISLKVTKTS